MIQKQMQVTWSIDVWVDDGDPVAAARAALEVQRDPESTALVFDVVDEETDHKSLVDLQQDKGEELI